MHKSLYVVNVDGTLALLRKQNNYCGLKDLNVETLAASPLCQDINVYLCLTSMTPYVI